MAKNDEFELTVTTEPNDNALYPRGELRSSDRGKKRASEQENNPKNLPIGELVRKNNEKTENPFDVNDEKYFPKGQYAICLSCHKPISQLKNLTNIDGKPIHKSCKAEIEAQKRKEWRCPQLAALDGRPFCNRIQNILAKPEDCSDDCRLLQEAP